MWQAGNYKNTKRTFQVLFNLILWGMWVGLPLLSPVHQTHNTPNPHRNPEFSAHIWVELMTVMPLFYVITLLLIPYVFKKKGIWVFFAVLILTNVGFFFFQEVFHHFLVSAIASSYGLLLEFLEQDSNKEEQKNEQLKSELSFLRSQISPHFIFNILNSIVYLIRTKASEQAEDVTMRLSSLMRYMLYDSDQTMVPLTNELAYLENYIDLQKMRFDGNVAFDFQVKGDGEGQMIEPMLLIPFVENAVKHGVGLVEKPFIMVQLESDEQRLRFQVKNKKGKEEQVFKDPSSGIGLKNVKRRLELLYPNKYTLEIKEDELNFSVDLTLELK
ncbi:MAG: histidine kinase [Cytophagales bacterium]|nr:histidine kinase [Cytophagales bacterium]